MMTRRFLLAAASITATAAAIPAPLAAVAAETAAPVRLQAWVVGTPDAFDWVHIRAASAEDAVAEWMASGGLPVACEEPGPEDTCGDCDFCAASPEAQRVPAFDAIDKPTPADWIRAGMGYTCSRCHDEMDSSDAHVIGDDAICRFCLTDTEASEFREALS